MAVILDQLPDELSLRVWMSAGEHEGRYVDDVSPFRRLFVSEGITASDVETLIVEDGTHSRLSWRPSAGPMLRFMFLKP